MNSQNVLKFCMEKGFLVEPGILNLFEDLDDPEDMKWILERIGCYSRSRIINKNILLKNVDFLREILSEFPSEKLSQVESLRSKMNSFLFEKELLEFSINESQKKNNEATKKQEFLLEKGSVKVFSKIPPLKPKLDVTDFVKNLRDKFNVLKNVLQEHQELENLVSIDKLSGKNQKSSIIGIVSNKQTTKNKNIMLEVEDLSGKIKILINQKNQELYLEAENIALDSVLGFVGFGDKEIFFANKIVFPDVPVIDKKYSNKEEYALFLGDIHYGSKLFMRENFLRFIDYLNGKDSNFEEVKKIKYLIIAGDIIAGIGIYPNQVHDLEVIDLEEQFKGFANLLSKIRKDITIIISSGNHDGVRLMEPQPPLDEKYAWPLYDLDNVVLVSNPANVNIGSNETFQGFNILIYHGYSYPYYANNIPCLIEKGLSAPDKIMNYLLKNRHLAPSNSSTQYFPSDKDELIIRDIPDIFFSGHIHKMAIDFYKGVLVICGATWEQETELIKKYGNLIDLCKVPMLNLKTREIKILDFE